MGLLTDAYLQQLAGPEPDGVPVTRAQPDQGECGQPRLRRRPGHTCIPPTS
jgi:hypothetical protein